MLLTAEVMADDGARRRTTTGTAAGAHATKMVVPRPETERPRGWFGPSCNARTSRFGYPGQASRCW